MSCDHRSVRHDDVIPDNAIMRHMHICHEQAVIAYARLLAFTRSRMYRNEFPDRCTVTNKCIALLTFILQILRYITNRCELEYMAILPYARISRNAGMWTHNGSLTDLNMRTYNSIWTDLDVLTDTCTGIDDSRVMYKSNNFVVRVHNLHPLSIPALYNIPYRFPGLL